MSDRDLAFYKVAFELMIYKYETSGKLEVPEYFSVKENDSEIVASAYIDGVENIFKTTWV